MLSILSHLTRSTLFLLVIISMALAACQTAPNGPESTGPAASPTATLAPEKRATRTPAVTATPAASPTPPLLAYLDVSPGELNGIVIEFWHPWSGELGNTAELLASDFSQNNEWGIRIRRKPLYSAGALYDEVKAGLSSDPVSLPDVVAAPSDQLVEWASGPGIVADLSGYIHHPRVGLSEAELETYQPDFWAQDQQEESQVGLPLLRSARVIFYNQTWARELGFSSPPETPAEFKKQACAAAVANNRLRLREMFGTGGWLIDTDPQTLLSWLAAFGAQVLPEDPGAAYTFESEEGEAAMAYLRGMLDDGCAWLGRSQTQHETFARRMALFYAGNLQDLYVQKGLNEALQVTDEWTILPFPSEDRQPVVYSSGYSLALLDPQGGPPETEQARKERMAGWLFIRWLAQPKNQARLAEALPSLPVSSAVEAQLADYHQNFPWGMILPLRDSARAVPGLASWRAVRRLVEDAAWQIYHLPADQVKLILPQLDEMVQEIVKKK